MATTSLNVSRAGTILLLLGNAGVQGASLKDLSNGLQAAKPAVLRCLNSLIELGFAEQVSRGRYRLGPSIFSLARSEGAVQTEVARWRSALEEIVQEFGQTVYLVRRAGLDVVVVDKQIGTAPIQALISDIGGRLPMGIGAGSVSILASLDRPDWEAVLRKNAAKYGDWKLEVDAISSHIEQASNRGYACDIELFVPECAGLAVPIRDRGRYESDLALTLSVPKSYLMRNRPAHVAKRLKEIIEKNQSTQAV